VDVSLSNDQLCLNPPAQLYSAFGQGKTVEKLAVVGVLDDLCRRIFRFKTDSEPAGRTMRLHRHHEEAVRIAEEGNNYALTTGIGSGKRIRTISVFLNRLLSNKRQQSFYLPVTAEVKPADLFDEIVGVAP